MNLGAAPRRGGGGRHRRSHTGADEEEHGAAPNGGAVITGGVFKSAAYEVLSTEQRLMTSGEITKLAIERRLLKCMGKTPENTMASALYTEVRKKAATTVFIKPKEGLFGLKSWLTEPWLLSWLAQEGIEVSDLMDPVTGNVTVPHAHHGHAAAAAGPHAEPMTKKPRTSYSGGPRTSLSGMGPSPGAPPHRGSYNGLPSASGLGALPGGRLSLNGLPGAQHRTSLSGLGGAAGPAGAGAGRGMRPTGSGGAGSVGGAGAAGADISSSLHLLLDAANEIEGGPSEDSPVAKGSVPEGMMREPSFRLMAQQPQGQAHAGQAAPTGRGTRRPAADEEDEPYDSHEDVDERSAGRGARAGAGSRRTPISGARAGQGRRPSWSGNVRQRLSPAGTSGEDSDLTGEGEGSQPEDGGGATGRRVAGRRAGWPRGVEAAEAQGEQEHAAGDWPHGSSRLRAASGRVSHTGADAAGARQGGLPPLPTPMHVAPALPLQPLLHGGQPLLNLFQGSSSGSKGGSPTVAATEHTRERDQQLLQAATAAAGGAGHAGAPHGGLPPAALAQCAPQLPSMEQVAQHLRAVLARNALGGTGGSGAGAAGGTGRVSLSGGPQPAPAAPTAAASPLAGLSGAHPLLGGMFGMPAGLHPGFAGGLALPLPAALASQLAAVLGLGGQGPRGLAPMGSGIGESKGAAMAAATAAALHELKVEGSGASGTSSAGGAAQSAGAGGGGAAAAGGTGEEVVRRAGSGVHAEVAAGGAGGHRQHQQGDVAMSETGAAAAEAAAVTAAAVAARAVGYVGSCGGGSTGSTASVAVAALHEGVHSPDSQAMVEGDSGYPGREGSPLVAPEVVLGSAGLLAGGAGDARDGAKAQAQGGLSAGALPAAEAAAAGCSGGGGGEAAAAEAAAEAEAHAAAVHTAVSAQLRQVQQQHLELLPGVEAARQGDVPDPEAINRIRQQVLELEARAGPLHPETGRAYVLLARVLEHKGTLWSLGMAERALLRAWTIVGISSRRASDSGVGAAAVAGVAAAAAAEAGAAGAGEMLGQMPDSFHTFQYLIEQIRLKQQLLQQRQQEQQMAALLLAAAAAAAGGVGVGVGGVSGSCMGGGGLLNGLAGLLATPQAAQAAVGGLGTLLQQLNLAGTPGPSSQGPPAASPPQSQQQPSSTGGSPAPQ